MVSTANPRDIPKIHKCGSLRLKPAAFHRCDEFRFITTIRIHYNTKGFRKYLFEYSFASSTDTFLRLLAKNSQVARFTPGDACVQRMPSRQYTCVS